MAHRTYTTPLEIPNMGSLGDIVEHLGRLALKFSKVFITFFEKFVFVRILGVLAKLAYFCDHFFVSFVSKNNVLLAL